MGKEGREGPPPSPPFVYNQEGYPPHPSVRGADQVGDWSDQDTGDQDVCDLLAIIQPLHAEKLLPLACKTLKGEIQEPLNKAIAAYGKVRVGDVHY